MNNPDFNIVRHAVSIDERRAFFRQHLFGHAESDKQNVKEICFAGVHSDIGGSYPESESELSKITLQWIVSDAESAGLRLAQHLFAVKPWNLGDKPDDNPQMHSVGCCV